MKIALIGDVHANLPALEAVLAHAHQQGVEAIWNLGDFLGYGAFPDEVVVRLRAEGALSIIGNYDLKVLKFPKRKEKWDKSKHPQKYLAFQWAYEHLSKESRKYLRSLPEEIQIGLPWVSRIFFPPLSIWISSGKERKYSRFSLERCS